MKEKIIFAIKRNTAVYKTAVKIKVGIENGRRSCAFFRGLTNPFMGMKDEKFKVSSIRSYAENHECLIQELEPAQERIQYSPKFFEGKKEKIIKIKTPAIYYCVLDYAAAIGMSDAVIGGGTG